MFRSSRTHRLLRRTIPRVELLESRLVPAVLDLPIVGGYLQYTTGPSDNTVTFDESLGKVYITDTDIIFLTQDAIDAGWTGNLQHIVSGPSDSFSSLEAWLGNGNDFAAPFSGLTHPLVLHGGQGNDTLSGSASYWDSMFGDDGADWLYGGAGSDTLNGGAGNDRLDGDAGNDWLTGGGGNDTCLGDDGTDQIRETANENMTLTNNSLTGGTLLGQDHLASIERAFLQGGSSANRIDAGAFSGFTTQSGHGGRDTLVGGSGPDQLLGMGGSDRLLGNEGDDELEGGAGDDTCNGGKGTDLLLAEYAGSMVLTNSQLNGGATLGTDSLVSMDRADLRLDQGLDGGTIDASAFSRGPVTLWGSDGDDTLIGTGKADELVGYAGDDLLRGLEGNDTLDGGDGTDTLNGGLGTDEGIDGEVENSIES